MNNLLLRNYQNLELIVSSEYVAEQIIIKWKELIKASKNGTVEIIGLEKLLYRWSIDVLITIFLGNTSNGRKINQLLQPLLNEFTSNVHKVFEFSAKLLIIPANLAKNLNLKIWTDFEESVTKTLELANRIIDFSLSNETPESGLLKQMIDTGMTMENIKRIFADMVIAAGDTTAFSMQWSMYLLARESEQQEIIRDELRECQSTDTDYESLIVRGVVRETLRMYPVAPFIGRFINADSVIGSYRIPKDTLVLLSLFTSGRDSLNFTKPLEFDPHRWNRNSQTHCDYNFKSNASLPFAFGSRSCIGRKIANTQMHVLTTKVIKPVS